MRGITVRPVVRLIKQQTKLVVAGVTAGLMIGGVCSVVVLAAVPDTSGVIHACYRTGGLLANGQVRIIDSETQTCNANETAITWNQQGPQGPQGPAGPQGAGGSALRSDVTGADFTKASMAYFDLSNLNFTGANFQEANLTGAVFDNANLSGVNFQAVRLNNVDLSGHDLSSIDLTGADLRNANLNDTNIQAGKNLRGVRLTGTNFGNAILVNADLRESLIVNQDFSNRNLSGIILAESEEEEIGGVRLENGNFDGANLTGADMSCGVYVWNSSFKNAVMDSVTWGNCPSNGPDLTIDNDFTGADFTNATLTNLDLQGSIFTGAVFANTTWEDVICPDGTNSDNNGNTCVGHL